MAKWKQLRARLAAQRTSGASASSSAQAAKSDGKVERKEVSGGKQKKRGKSRSEAKFAHKTRGKTASAAAAAAQRGSKNAGREESGIGADTTMIGAGDGVESGDRVGVRESTSKRKRKRKRKRKGQNAPMADHDVKKPKKGKQANVTAEAAKAAGKPKVAKKQDAISQSKLGRLRTKLEGAQFRWLNEKLYTCEGQEALEYFAEHPEDFSKYHLGFRKQAKKWPKKPVDEYTAFLAANPELVAGDFGCGEAFIAQRVSNKVHSFDLVAVNEHVTACDMSSVPLADKTLDVAIFCLSLMGTNYMQFIVEANRVLRSGGKLKIAEVESRFDGDYSQFRRGVQAAGFRFEAQSKLGKVFMMFDFEKVKDCDERMATQAEQRCLELKPCIYKRR